MDVFQLVGDLLHLIAMIMLVLNILANRNVLGLSYRTQELYLVVFACRYIGILFGWTSLYLFAMKVLFISLTSYTIYLIKFRRPYTLVIISRRRAMTTKTIGFLTTTFMLLQASYRW